MLSGNSIFNNRGKYESNGRKRKNSNFEHLKPWPSRPIDFGYATTNYYFMKTRNRIFYCSHSHFISLIVFDSSKCEVFMLHILVILYDVNKKKKNVNNIQEF